MRPWPNKTDVLDGLTKKPFKEAGRNKHSYDASRLELFEQICESPSNFTRISAPRGHLALPRRRDRERFYAASAGELVEWGAAPRTKAPPRDARAMNRRRGATLPAAISRLDVRPREWVEEAAETEGRRYDGWAGLNGVVGGLRTEPPSATFLLAEGVPRLRRAARGHDRQTFRRGTRGRGPCGQDFATLARGPTERGCCWDTDHGQGRDPPV